MADFKHSHSGSIPCPLHNRQEAFTAGGVIQPTDPTLVRYPCGYVEELKAVKSGMEPLLLTPSQDEFIKELMTRLKRLEERGVPRRIPSAPAPQSPNKKGGVAL